MGWGVDRRDKKYLCKTNVTAVQNGFPRKRFSLRIEILLFRIKIYQKISSINYPSKCRHIS